MIKKITLAVLLAFAGFALYSQSYSPMEWVDSYSFGSVNNTDEGYAAVYDSEGNLYIGGLYSSSEIVFGEDTLRKLATNSMAFIAKRSPSGQWLWARQISDRTSIHSLGIDADGNIYASGNFMGDNIYFPNDVILNGTPFGIYGIFAAKFSPDGDCLWAKPAGTNSIFDSHFSSATDADGNTFLTGYYIGTMMAGSHSVENLGGSSTFIAKIDSGGNWVWLRRIGGAVGDRGRAIAIDSENVYVAGTHSSEIIYYDADSTISTEKTRNEAFYIAKLSKDGEFLSANKIESPYSMNVSALVYHNSALYVTGSSWGSLDLGNDISISSGGASNLFVAKYSTELLATWVKSPQGGGSSSKGITAHNDLVYIVGELGGNIVCDAISISNAKPRGGLVIGIDEEGSWVSGLSTLNCGSETASSYPIFYAAAGNGDKLSLLGVYRGRVSTGDNCLENPGSGSTTYDVLLAVATVPIKSEQPILPESISLSSQTDTLDIGAELEIIAEVLPENATDNSLEWYSSDESVATVNSQGVVTAVAAGNVSITAISVANNNVIASLDLVVRQYVESIVFAEEELQVTVGDTLQLQVTVSPENATNKKLEWSSDDPAIVGVDDSGQIVAKAAGSVYVYAASTDRSGAYSYIWINVSEPIILPDSIRISGPAQLQLGQSAALSVSFLPENASNQTVYWASSDEGIAVVNTSGRVTALSPGTVTITATSRADGSVTDEITIVVGSSIIPVQ
jgi:uncharacterized protein YjdB